MPDLQNKLAAILQGLGLENPQIDVYTSRGSILANVISDSYTNMDEFERQNRIWTALQGSLTDEEQNVVEFVFTIAPEELEDAEEAV